MSQRVRRNGSPTPAGGLAGGAGVPAGGPGSRLQPMRATVPFQLKQQQQHGSPTRGGGGGGGGNNGGGAPGPSGGGGGGGPRTASRSTSPTRGGGGGGGSVAARTSPTVATQTGAPVTSPRGTAPAARASPPRPPPPPPLLATVSSPGSSPTHLWPGELPAAPPPARVRHRRRSPEQGRPSAEKRSPSAPVCKAGTRRPGGGGGGGPGPPPTPARCPRRRCSRQPRASAGRRGSVKPGVWPRVAAARGRGRSVTFVPATRSNACRLHAAAARCPAARPGFGAGGPRASAEAALDRGRVGRLGVVFAFS
nr:protein FAM117B [Meriones unguiculatus]